MSTPVRQIDPFTFRTGLVWLPAVGVAALLAWSAITGGSLIPTASAATTIDVTGLVDEYVYLDGTGCSSASSLDLGEIIPGDPWKRTNADCSVLFGTSNSALGADLNVLEDPAAPPTPVGAMKCIVASCTGGSVDGQLDDVAPGSTAPATAASAFGMQLESSSGIATGGWIVGAVYPVATSSTACSTAAIGDGICAFRFGAAALATDGPGAYQAQVQFLVLAR